MKILNNISLKKYNSFNVNAIAKHFVEIENEEQIIELANKYDFADEKYFILGNGTNTLFAVNFYDGLVIKNNIKHTLNFDLIDNKNIIITASSGIDYDVLLKEYFNFLNKNNIKTFCGLENLSQIPTSVGAAIVQNVGAYSIDQTHLLCKCNTINLLNGKQKSFNKNECNLDYRNSFFKQNPTHFITEIQYIIPINNDIPILDYADFSSHTELVSASPKSIYDYVASIRKNKIPSHLDFPNCGSFFKNPIISQELFNEIIKVNSNIMSYKNSNGNVKLSAANLIENCQLKGFRVGDVGVSSLHSLFIINYANATGKEIITFAEHISDKVFEKYGVRLVPEVVIVR